MLDTKPDQAAAENGMRQRRPRPDLRQNAGLGRVPDLKAALKEILAALEPEVLDAAYARELVEEFAAA